MRKKNNKTFALQLQKHMKHTYEIFTCIKQILLQMLRRIYSLWPAQPCLWDTVETDVRPQLHNTLHLCTNWFARTAQITFMPTMVSPPIITKQTSWTSTWQRSLCTLSPMEYMSSEGSKMCLDSYRRGKKILNQIKISSSNHGLSSSTPTEETSTREGAVVTGYYSLY